ncbi:MAG TPA: hypothetical protein VFD43_04190 [Planctomycetota bacterium]|nr:hypothetical protein [Planctomycetota bacterium]
MTGFLVALVATLAALGGTLWAGLTRRRGLHYALVAAMLVSLGVTIWRARIWGAGLVFDGAAGSVQLVHRAAVVVTFALLPLVAWTGLRLARTPGLGSAPGSPARAAHRRRAVQFVLALVAAAVLGTVMSVLARRV